MKPLRQPIRTWEATKSSSNLFFLSSISRFRTSSPSLEHQNGHFSGPFSHVTRIRGHFCVLFLHRCRWEAAWSSWAVSHQAFARPSVALEGTKTIKSGPFRGLANTFRKIQVYFKFYMFQKKTIWNLVRKHKIFSGIIFL